VRLIEAILYFEVLGRTRLAVEDRVKRTVDGLKMSPLEIKRLDIGDVIEDPELDPLSFSALLEARVEGELRDLADAVAEYGPTLVEILKPGRIEVPAEGLSDLLLNLARKVRELRGGRVVIPIPQNLKEIPVPEVGFDEEELWEAVYQGRELLYRLSLVLPREMERDTLLKLLLLEGCGVNELKITDLDGVREFSTEAVSSFESLFAVAFRYSPKTLEILEPPIVDITAPELQNALSDLGSFVNSILMGEDLQKAYEKDTFSFKLG